jgi:hypothetical protein
MWGDAEIRQNGDQVTLETHTKRLFKGTLAGRQLDLRHPLALEETKSYWDMQVRQQLVGEEVALRGPVSDDGKTITFDYYDRKAHWTHEGDTYKVTDTYEDKLNVTIEFRRICEGDWLEQAAKKLGEPLGTAGDVRTAVRRNVTITSAYREMYLSEPRVFKWAGMAAFASSSVGFGITTIKDLVPSVQESVKEVVKKVASDAARPKGDSDFNDFIDLCVSATVEVCDLHATALRLSLLNALVVGNKAVYTDIYWQHIAYRECGVDALERLHAKGKLSDRALAAWKKIDGGITVQNPYAWRLVDRVITGTNPDLIWQGNAELLKYEQEVVLQQAVYTPRKDTWREITNIPVIFEIDSPIPGDTVSFQDYAKLHAGGATSDIGDFSQRWDWISNSMLPRWRALSDGQGSDVEGKLKKLTDN